MKRHESLMPISRHHGEGVFLARMLQYNAPAHADIPPSPSAKCKYLQGVLKHRMAPHFELEEATVFRFAKEGSEELQKQAAQLVEEHRQIEQSILALPEAKNGELPDKLDALGKLLERHIYKEEHVFFNKLQEELSEEKLQELKQAVERHRLL